MTAWPRSGLVAPVQARSGGLSHARDCSASPPRSRHSACSVSAPAFGQAAAEQVQPRTVDIAAHVAEASQRFGLPEQLDLRRDAHRKRRPDRCGLVSGCDGPDAAHARNLGAPAHPVRAGAADPFDPRDNIMAGTSYLREMYDSYGASGFLAAYNAGPGRYEDWRDRGRPLPAETRAYVAKIAPMLQAGSAATVVASASPVQPVRLSWTQGQLFAVRGTAATDASGSFAAAAPPTSISRFVCPAERPLRARFGERIAVIAVCPSGASWRGIGAGIVRKLGCRRGRFRRMAR
jgi:hypothetical protein